MRAASVTTATLFLTFLGVCAAPNPILPRQSTQTNGTCDVATNTCTIDEPADLAGLQLNCGTGGTEAPKGPPCAVEGHVCCHLFLILCDLGRFVSLKKANFSFVLLNSLVIGMGSSALSSVLRQVV